MFDGDEKPKLAALLENDDRSSGETGGMAKVRFELFGSRGYIEGQHLESWIPLKDIRVAPFRVVNRETRIPTSE